MTKPDQFKDFQSSPEIIRLAVMLYVRFALSLRNVEDLLHERGIDVSHEAMRYWWHRFGSMFASEIRNRRIHVVKSCRWRLHFDHKGEVLESFFTKTRDKKAALKFLKKAMRNHGRPEALLWRCVERDRRSRQAGKRALVEQQGGEFSLAVSTLREGHAPFQAHSRFVGIRLSPRPDVQPVQLGKKPPLTTQLQTQPRRCSCRMARSRRGIGYSVAVHSEAGSN